MDDDTEELSITQECESCGDEVEVTWLYKDPDSGELFSLCWPCNDMMRKADGSEAAISIPFTSQTDTQTTAITVVTQPAKPPQFNCRSCYKNITDLQKFSEGEGTTGWLCKECYDHREMLKWWSDNYEMGQTLWNELPKTDTSWCLDIDTLRQYCTADEDWFHTLPGAQVIPANPDWYIFFDHGSDILFVGHLDIAGRDSDRKPFAYYEGKDGQHYVFNRNLDDRLGVYMGHYVLPTQFGIQCDVLLTTNEESGGSTAQDFMNDWLRKPEGERKHYKWVIEFDRRGKEPVLYQYKTQPWHDAIAEFTTIAVGTLSDISYMDQLGCCCVNWNTGYYDEHTARHFAVLEDTMDALENFAAFHAKYKDTHFPYTYQRVVQINAWDRWGDYREADDYAYVRTATPIVCDLCLKDCYTRHRIEGTAGNKSYLLVCSACKAKYKRTHNVSLERLKKGESILVCEDCGEEQPCLYRHRNGDLCWYCFIRKYRPSTITANKVCKICETSTPDYIETLGGIYCVSCYAREFGVG